MLLEENNMSLRELCPVLQFGDLGDERGKLVVIEGGQSIPFDIKRIFIYTNQMRQLFEGNMRIEIQNLFW